MDLKELQGELAALQNNSALYVPEKLHARAEALDFLRFLQEVIHMERKATLLATQLRQEAEEFQRRLVVIDKQLYQTTRKAIQQKQLVGDALRAYCDRFTDYRPSMADRVYTSYDGLDVLFDGIFQLNQAPAPTLTPEAEMVHCEETPARALLDLIDHVGLQPGDIFYDLGSGLGQVVMALHLLTGIRAKGVEIEPAFCAFARRQADALNLPGATFINADARLADYSDGTVFFLFTPFRGQLLQRVLARLQQVACHHPIRICTFGSCTPHVAEQPWLQPHTMDARHEYKLVIFSSHT